MGDLKSLFAKIRTSFSVRKRIDFDEYDLHIEMEPLTAIQELRVLEACKDYDGGAYIEALKKHSLAYGIKQINDYSFEREIVQYPDEGGQMVEETPYLFLSRQIEGWPAALRDIIFEAYQNMLEEVQHRIDSKAKFERFTVTSEVEAKKSEPVPEGFKRVDVPDEPEPQDEVERMNQTIRREGEQVHAAMDNSTQDAIDRYSK